MSSVLQRKLIYRFKYRTLNNHKIRCIFKCALNFYKNQSYLRFWNGPQDISKIVLNPFNRYTWKMRAMNGFFYFEVTYVHSLWKASTSDSLDMSRSGAPWQPVGSQACTGISIWSQSQIFQNFLRETYCPPRKHREYLVRQYNHLAMKNIMKNVIGTGIESHENGI